MQRHHEEGSIEAGLTLIPTTAFFLLVLQLVVVGTYKTVETLNLQSWLNKSALFAIDGSSENKYVGGKVNALKSFQLPGGGELLLAESTSAPPIISSFATPLSESGIFTVRSNAAAVRE
jgi:hypothetical protein